MAQDVEEGHFRRLYDKVLDDCIELTDIPEEEIYEAISSIKDSFRWSEGGRFLDIDFNRLSMCCGYIDRYGPHGAGLARCKTLQALENCPELRSVLRKPQLNVASLGGGPGNDAIGFCSAISRFQFAGNLRIQVVDAAERWGNFIFVITQMLHEGDFGDVSRLFQQRDVHLFFSSCRIPGQLCYLDHFDVILICKLISIMDWFDKNSLVQKLHSTMKESALILLIDSPFNDQLWSEKFEVLYLSREGDEYCSGTRGEGRFIFNDYVKSWARIAVLRKKTPPPPYTT